MLIKDFDASVERVEQLQRARSAETDPAKKAEIGHLIARMRATATSEHACEFLNRYFGETPDWCLIHDLNLKCQRSSLQISHLMIDRNLHFYIIDSRYIHYGLCFDRQGGCILRSTTDERSIASPLNKMRKDVRLLRQIIRDARLLPRWYGAFKPPVVRGYVLTNGTLRNSAPGAEDTDHGDLAVVPHQSFFRTVWKQDGDRQNFWYREGAVDLIRTIAIGIERLHHPMIDTSMLGIHSSHAVASEQDGCCALCGSDVPDDVREYSFRNIDLYQGQLLCLQCQIRPGEKNSVQDISQSNTTLKAAAGVG